MKKAINAWSVEDSVNFEDMFRIIKEAGFDGIELNVDKPGKSAHSLSYETTEQELLNIKSISEKYGLPVCSISSSLYGGLMGTKEACENMEVRRLLEKQLQAAKVLGAKGILMVPGGISEDNSISEAYKYSDEIIEKCKDIIDKYKIPVGLENVWNQFFMSPFDMINFIDNLSSEYITAYYDVGNVLAFSYPEYWIEILGSRISLIHIKDFKRKAYFNQGGEFVDLLKGSARWDKIMPALRSIGFDGYLTAEVFVNKGQAYEDFYKEVSEAIDKIITI